MIGFEVKSALLEKELSDERKRLSSDRLDISYGELINLYKNKELVIRPEYQRLFRWSSKQKTALIESILLQIPVPPIFVAEDKEGVWELVDGLQRVSTFISFFGELDKSVSEIVFPLADEDNEEVIEDITETSLGNHWPLEEGGLVKNLEGFTINTLPGNLKINLKRAVCRVEILRGESSTSMKYELFKRLNSGGSILTPQEIRNAIYRGVDTRLNESLLKVSQSEVFKRLTQLSKTKSRELYDQELVLRFYAFLSDPDSINGNTENYLNTFMEETVNDPNYGYEVKEALLMNVLNKIIELGDEKIFRNERNLFVPAYFEGVTIGFAVNFDRYINDLGQLNEKVQELKTDLEYKKYSGSASNSTSRIRNRLKRARVIFSN